MLFQALCGERAAPVARMRMTRPQRHGLRSVYRWFTAVFLSRVFNRFNDLPVDGFSTVLKP
jgi:hypothetical protein